MRLHGVRIPKAPNSVPYVALGIALASIGYGLCVKGYRKVQTARRSKKNKAKAQ